MTRSGLKRHFDSISSNAKTTTRSKASKKRTTQKCKSGEVLEEHPATTFKTPSNPQAMLEGLPAELRLQIYDHLCDSSIIHVHRHDDKETHKSRFTWTPCRSPSSFSPLLCANPKWSGMCDEEDRCTYKIYAPPEPVGFWALAASNKQIRTEAQEFFLRRTVVSIHPHNLITWLDHLADHTPQQIDHLRRITLAGASVMRRPHNHQHFSKISLQALRDRVPNLEGVGFQCQDMMFRWAPYGNKDIDIRPGAWKKWEITEWVKPFDSSITIALEAMVSRQLNRSDSVIGQQVAVRILRDGQQMEEGITGPVQVSGLDESGWSDDDVKVEIDKGRLLERKRNAKWRRWWNGEEMLNFVGF